MEWYDRSENVHYKIFTRFNYPLVVSTSQEEEDLRAMCKIKDTTFKITNERDELGPAIERMMDGMEDVYHKITGNVKKLTFGGVFLVAPFLVFLIFVFLCYAAMFVHRVAYKKELYREEIQPLYKDTVKAINRRYEKRILNLAGLKDEKNGRK